MTPSKSSSSVISRKRPTGEDNTSKKDGLSKKDGVPQKDGDLKQQPESPPAPRADDFISDRKPTSPPASTRQEPPKSTKTRPKVRLLRKGEGGVAPFVAPHERLSRHRRLKELGKRGFVPVTPAKQKLRHRILPRTVIGIAGFLMALGVGAAFSGAAFYAYYDDRLAESEETVGRFVESFDTQFTDATGAIDSERVKAVKEIRRELDPLSDWVADTNGIVALPETMGQSVWSLRTQGEEGEAVAGSAFAIVGHQGGTAMLTSFSLVSEATTQPAPALELVKNGEVLPAELWSWDEERDLALLIVDKEIPIVEINKEPAGLVGSRVFVVSGAGQRQATASPGVLLDASGDGLQHTVPVGAMFAGGPVVNAEGKTIGIAAPGFQPFGVDPGVVGQSPDVSLICQTILKCAVNVDEVEIEVAEETATEE